MHFGEETGTPSSGIAGSYRKWVFSARQSPMGVIQPTPCQHCTSFPATSQLYQLGVLSVCLIFNYCIGCEVVSHYGFNLISLMFKRFSSFSYVYWVIGYLDHLIYEVLIQIFCQFFYWAVCSFLIDL